MLVDFDVARGLLRGTDPQERPYVAALPPIFSFGGSLRHGGRCLCILPTLPKLSGHPEGPEWRCQRTLWLVYTIVQKDIEDLVLVQVALELVVKNRYMFPFAAKITTSSRTWSGMSREFFLLLAHFGELSTPHTRPAPIYSGRANQGELGGGFTGLLGESFPPKPCSLQATPTTFFL